MDLSSINVADIAVTLVILFSGLFAFFRGFVHEILAVASWVGLDSVTSEGDTTADVARAVQFVGGSRR